MEALNSRLEAEELRKRREGKRVYPCRLRYIWVKEKNYSDNWHYHVCILLNRDAYFTLGKFKHDKENRDVRSNMADRINDAWASALKILPEISRGLVHFSHNPIYYIDCNTPEAFQQYSDLFYRLSYFAKVETKHYGDHSKNFGCSRK